uniref:Putative heat shock factor binding protein n=1 Tax=Oryza officinalis TaxID=4535 RepID=D4N3U1_9ORYZ|nr:putative heat shock factor binding protein [Oryza officinalis]
MAAPGSGSGGIPIKADQDSDGSAQSTADMTAFVQNLLMQMQTRFQSMSENIISKIDEMGARIDELEQSINDLKVEMGTEGITPTKPKDEESKPADSSAE